MPDSGKEQILSHISDVEQKNIRTLFEKIEKNKEFEFIFFSKKGHHMGKEKYVLLLKYVRNISKAKKYRIAPPERTLDVNYVSDNGNTYRVSITGSNEINKILSKVMNIQNKNYIIYKFLLYTMMREKSNKDLSLMVKIKEEGDTIDIDDLNMRIRLSTENDIGRNIGPKTFDDNLSKILAKEGQKIDMETREILNNNISFRLKERTSLYINDADTHFIRIDLTDTKTTKDIRKLQSTFSNYELEIEYGLKNAKAPKKEHLDTMYVTVENLLKLTQQSSIIIGNAHTENVIKYYRDLIGVPENLKTLQGRQAVSLEIQHVTEILPNKYAVTDKADGERFFMVIYNNNVYLISNNLNVKDTGIILDKNLSKYNGTMMDGEYIYLQKEKRHLFMVFDCLRNGGNDLRSIISIKQRLDNADQIINDCFIFKIEIFNSDSQSL